MLGIQAMIQKLDTVGIWNPTIWNPETFKIRTFWRSDFKQFCVVRFQMILCTTKNCSLPSTLCIRLTWHLVPLWQHRLGLSKGCQHTDLLFKYKYISIRKQACHYLADGVVVVHIWNSVSQMYTLFISLFIIQLKIFNRTKTNFFIVNQLLCITTFQSLLSWRYNCFKSFIIGIRGVHLFCGEYLNIKAWQLNCCFTQVGF